MGFPPLLKEDGRGERLWRHGGGGVVVVVRELRERERERRNARGGKVGEWVVRILGKKKKRGGNNFRNFIYLFIFNISGDSSKGG